MRKGKKIRDAAGDEIIRRIEQVHGIELNPLLITVFATTSEYNKQDIPANITELFKKFTELMLGRWDEGKGLSQQYQAPLKDFLLTRLAFLMHTSNRTKIPVDEFHNIMEHESSKRGHKLVGDQLVAEILNRSGLLRDSGGFIEFRHHFLQEFFAGRGIQSIDEVKALVYTEWWKRPIVFFFGDRPSDIRGLKEVIDSVPSSQSVEQFGAATTLGLAIQACYLSEVEEKINAWRWVSSAFHECREEVLEHIGAKEVMPLSGFIGYYLYGRDSLALSNIIEHSALLESWVFDADDDKERESRWFWLVSSYIELGYMELAKALLDKLEAVDNRHLLAIHLGCYLMEKVRSVSKNNKSIAMGICKQLSDVIASNRLQLLQEFSSQILEVRRGKIEAIEEETIEGEGEPVPGLELCIRSGE